MAGRPRLRRPASPSVTRHHSRLTRAPWNSSAPFGHSFSHAQLAALVLCLRGGALAGRRRHYLLKSVVTAGSAPACVAPATAVEALQRHWGGSRPPPQTPLPIRPLRACATQRPRPLPSPWLQRHGQAPSGPLYRAGFARAWCVSGGCTALVRGCAPTRLKGAEAPRCACAPAPPPLTRFPPLIGAGLVRVAWQPFKFISFYFYCRGF